MPVVRSVGLGCGAYLPETSVTNHDLAKTLDTTHEWIVSRTGIAERCIAARGELTSDIAIRAGREAIADSGVDARDIDLLIVATATPDLVFPATATRVQDVLGIRNGAAFDIQAVCAGFIYALAMADACIRAGTSERVLVIGAETFSRILDWEDRASCVLFGDGGGAILLGRSEGEGTASDRGVLQTRLKSDGACGNLLYVDGGVSSSQSSGKLRMKGQEVYRHAVEKLASIAQDTLQAAGFSGGEDVDWFVPHQANIRIIDSVAKRMNIPREKIVITVDRHGNTSAASVPLALVEAVRDGRIRRDDLLLMEAIGGGLVWGAAVVRW